MFRPLTFPEIEPAVPVLVFLHVSPYSYALFTFQSLVLAESPLELQFSYK
jgi:hypothetical protein